MKTTVVSHTAFTRTALNLSFSCLIVLFIMLLLRFHIVVRTSFGYHLSAIVNDVLCTSVRVCC